ncbi:hypothetical protein [Acinetobacter haemolyticus]|uniref:hypothetical protein n=1 Tax=Acinetobacter haemolyticus TaxID=29430 RepID=UPI001D18B108|nr:hypothetical protein [Acinetobacter haemolyticus]
MKLILPTLITLPLMLTGCGSSFNPDVLEVNLNTEYSPGGLYDRTYVILTIRSIDAEPIAVTNVNVNNGRCSYTGRYNDPIKLPAYFQIGQSLQLYLRCSYDAEPYRVCRRVNILRDYPDDKTKLYPRN